MAGQSLLIFEGKTDLWEKYDCCGVGRNMRDLYNLLPQEGSVVFCVGWSEIFVLTNKAMFIFMFFPFQGGSGKLPFGWAEPLCQQAVVLRVYAGETANKQ